MKNQNFVPCCTPITKESYNKMLPFLEGTETPHYNKELHISECTNSHLSNHNLDGAKKFIGTDKKEDNAKNIVSNFQFLINSGVELTLKDIYIEVNDDNRKEVIEFCNTIKKVMKHHIINTENCYITFVEKKWFHYGDYTNKIQATIQEIKEYFTPSAAPKENLTLENIQVDCTDLTAEQIEEMKRVVVDNGFELWNNPEAFNIDIYKGWKYLLHYLGDFYITCDDKNKTTITYDRFIELFNIKNTFNVDAYLDTNKGWSNNVGNRRTMSIDRNPYPKELSEKEPTLQSVDVYNPQPHYDNTNGSLYQISEQLGLNAYEFDIIKRVVRCRKKGQFVEDLQKTKDLIDLYLREYKDEL